MKPSKLPTQTPEDDLIQDLMGWLHSNTPMPAFLVERLVRFENEKREHEALITELSDLESRVLLGEASEEERSRYTELKSSVTAGTMAVASLLWINHNQRDELKAIREALGVPDGTTTLDYVKGIPKLRITKIVQTCYACPSQWDAETEDGRSVYIRYRHGHGTIEVDNKLFAVWHGADPMDGCISYDELREKFTNIQWPEHCS